MEITRRAAAAAIAATAAAPGAVRNQPAVAAERAWDAFPAGFIWGVAASAAQTESRRGRGRSNWDVFADTPGRIRDGSTNARCTEFDARYGEDIGLVAAAGARAFRFSIAWPRVQPDGPGEASAAGLDLYDRIVDEMLSAGLEPWPTLFHWDSPVWAGDFRERAIAQRLADYADLVVARLGDRISRWMLLNEANVVAVNGYLVGSHAPGLHDLKAASAAIHHQNLAQGLMAKAVRARLGAKAQVGSAVSLSPIVPATAGEADAAAAASFWDIWAGALIEPMMGRPYPGAASSLVAPYAMAGDAQIMAVHPDFLGVNYYARSYVRAGPPPLGFLPAPPPAGTIATDFFPFEPGGLTEILLQLTARYPKLPLVITETGFAQRDPSPADGRVEDPTRVAHLSAYVAAARAAIAGGADVRGLFYWAATDNWEWQQGFSKHFGLVALDPQTQLRTPKLSLAYFSACARANRVA
ncbi:MAG TPA: family 1 glycosylhydrolase [Caulobacteraceae bacterium]|jgi:beta-glucosidase|nr:family 1 glycosylhydrolase [Caulobacteraceae bacterium]